MFDSQPYSSAHKRSALASFMFASRWLQLPLYLGLIPASTSCSCCRRWRSPTPAGSWRAPRVTPSTT